MTNMTLVKILLIIWANLRKIINMFYHRNITIFYLTFINISKMIIWTIYISIYKTMVNINIWMNFFNKFRWIKHKYIFK
jgi:hypothetical protein